MLILTNQTPVKIFNKDVLLTHLLIIVLTLRTRQIQIKIQVFEILTERLAWSP